MHRGTSARFAFGPLGRFGDRIQWSVAVTIASLLPSEHGKRNDQDGQADDDLPEAVPTPGRLAAEGPGCRRALQSARKGIG